MNKELERMNKGFMRKDGKFFLPITHESLVVDNDGVRLTDKYVTKALLEEHYSTISYVDEAILKAQLGKDVDLSGYATIEQLEKELAKKADKLEIPVVDVDKAYVDEQIKEHTHEQYVTEEFVREELDKIDLSTSHIHTNKAILDTITLAKIDEWDSKSDFSGSYKDLSDIPQDLATEQFVLTEIAKVVAPNIDLSEYAKKADLENLASKEFVQAQDKALKEEFRKSLTHEVDLIHAEMVEEVGLINKEMEEEIKKVNDVITEQIQKVNSEHTEHVVTLYGKARDLKAKDAELSERIDALEAVDHSQFITEHQDISHLATTEEVDAALESKVDREELEHFADKDYVEAQDEFLKHEIDELWDKKADKIQTELKAEINENIETAVWSMRRDVDEEIGKVDTKHTEDVSGLREELEFVKTVEWELNDRLEVLEEIDHSAFLTEHQDVSHLATKEEIIGLATEEFVKEEIAKAQLEDSEVDLTDYAKKSDLEGLATEEYVDEKIAEIVIPEIPEEYDDSEIKSRLEALESVDHDSFLTEHQNISHLATRKELDKKIDHVNDIITEEVERLNQEMTTEVDKLNDIITEQIEKVNSEHTEHVITLYGKARDLKAKDAELQERIEKLEKAKYEIKNLPEGALVDYREKEIRVMCPVDTEFKQQEVGETGNPNMYYMSLVSQAPEGAVKLIESDGQKTEIIELEGKTSKTIWLALAMLSGGKWNYFGKSSTTKKYIGWTYSLKWLDENDNVIESDCFRINLANESCFDAYEPSCVGALAGRVETLEAIDHEAFLTEHQDISHLATKEEIEGFATEEYVDEKIANLEMGDVEVSVTFNTDKLTYSPLGGIGVDEDLNGLSLQEVITKLLYPYVAPEVSASISVSPSKSLYEKGDVVKVSKIAAVVNKKSEAITNVVFYVNNAEVESIVEGVENGGTFEFVFDQPLEITADIPANYFKIKVVDASNNTVNADTKAINFVYPYYFGVVDESIEINSNTIKSFSKVVKAKGNQSYDYTTDNQHMIIAYPKAYGSLSKIIDVNGFDITATFELQEVDVEYIDGTVQTYYVYKNNTSTVQNFTIKIYY